MLAEKIYKIRKELEEKRQRHRQQQGVPPGSGPSGAGPPKSPNFDDQWEIVDHVDGDDDEQDKVVDAKKMRKQKRYKKYQQKKRYRTNPVL